MEINFFCCGVFKSSLTDSQLKSVKSRPYGLILSYSYWVPNKGSLKKIGKIYLNRINYLSLQKLLPKLDLI